MKILLVHALKAEARLIRGHFPSQGRSQPDQELDIHELDERHDIICTGMGLDQTETTLARIPDPTRYASIFQFGVSGSLSDDLPIHTFIRGKTFSALNQDSIEASSSSDLNLPDLKHVNFYSARDAVTDETAREVAISQGGEAVDMESYAAAKFCNLHDIPFWTLRIISDRAGSSTAEDFKTNFKTASHLLQQYIIKHVLKG